MLEGHWPVPEGFSGNEKSSHCNGREEEGGPRQLSQGVGRLLWPGDNLF